MARSCTGNEWERASPFSVGKVPSRATARPSGFYSREARDGSMNQHLDAECRQWKSAQRPEFHAFFSWFLHAITMGSVAWPQLVPLLQHMLHQSLQDGADESLIPFLPELVGRVRYILNSIDEPSLLPQQRNDSTQRSASQ